MLPLVDPAARLVIAHRGNPARFPENTFSSFDDAVRVGADAMEFDVRLTRDDIAVVIHDPTVDRTTNGTGLVRELSVAELATLDAGARYTRDGGRTFPFRGQGVRVHTLEGLLARYTDIPLLIEVKEARAVTAVRDTLRRFGREAGVVIDSAADDAVRPFRREGFITGASYRDAARLLRSLLSPRPPGRLPYDALCIPRRHRGLPLPVRRLPAPAWAGGGVAHRW